MIEKTSLVKLARFGRAILVFNNNNNNNIITVFGAPRYASALLQYWIEIMKKLITIYKFLYSWSKLQYNYNEEKKKKRSVAHHSERTATSLVAFCVIRGFLDFFHPDLGFPYSVCVYLLVCWSTLWKNWTWLTLVEGLQFFRSKRQFGTYKRFLSRIIAQGKNRDSFDRQSQNLLAR